MIFVEGEGGEVTSQVYCNTLEEAQNHDSIRHYVQNNFDDTEEIEIFLKDSEGQISLLQTISTYIRSPGQLQATAEAVELTKRLNALADQEYLLTTASKMELIKALERMTYSIENPIWSHPTWNK